jgi:hypothetical protein
MAGPILLPGNPPVSVTLRRSARARRLSLRVSRLDGRVTLTLPAHAPEAEALAFAREKAGWIRARLAEQAPGAAVGIGATLPVEGRATLVVAGRRTRLVAPEGRLEVAGAAPAAAVAGVLKALARDRLTRASDRHAAALGRRYSRLTLRDTRSRWGSCSAAGALMYSWRLILAPPAVLDYVAAHEVAHLAEMNHGPAFWATVEALCPDWGAHRAWLRAEGEALHRWRFAG